MGSLSELLLLLLIISVRRLEAFWRTMIDFVVVEFSVFLVIRKSGCFEAMMGALLIREDAVTISMCCGCEAGLRCSLG